MLPIKPPDDPLAVEARRIFQLSNDQLVAEVSQMAANWAIEHSPDLRGYNGVSGTQAISQAYRFRLTVLPSKSAGCDPDDAASWWRAYALLSGDSLGMTLPVFRAPRGVKL